jgi:N-acetyl-anhydromuramyl-L-alanine amidase AmpD
MITQIAGGIVVQDISNILPRHKTKRYSKRRSSIERIYIHHSGKLGADGIDGPINSTRYIISRKKSPFPGAPYHFWIPFNNVYAEDEDRSYVIYRLQPDEVRCYHTGRKANSHGVGVALQGNTSTNGLSDFQIECLEALVPWLLERHNLELPDGLSYHAEADKYGGKRKPACPGVEATEWINDYRDT